jgi:hypothetical protein
VNDTVDPWMRSKDLVKAFFVGDVDLVEIWPLPTKELDTIERDFGGVVQTIDDHNFVAMLKQCQRGERANVTGSSMHPNISFVL